MSAGSRFEGILPGLRERGVERAGPEALDAVQRAGVGRHFRDELLPALTPWRSTPRLRSRCWRA